MSKFEWMELETLSNQIAHAQSRLDTARATKNHGLVKLLQREIAEIASRRAQVLTRITKGLGVVACAKPSPSPATLQSSAPRETDNSEQAQPEQVPPALLISGDVPRETNRSQIVKEGDAQMWDKLTRADIEHFKRELGGRRSDLLARHADELKALDTEQTEIDAIEQAIEVFARKFKLTGRGEVVPFAGEVAAHSQAS